jgi:hypothetical protein
MPRIVIAHSVVEVERWLRGKQERAAVFAPFGSDVRDLVAMDGSNQVAVSADVDDLEGVQTMLTSMPPEVAAQAESHGVIPPFVVYIER